MTELELKIFEIVRNIPRGKVATYGQIADVLGNKHLARIVGNVMHKNPVPYWDLALKTGYKCNKCELDYYRKFGMENNFKPVPCHRIVNGSGKMGSNFGLGGPEVQKKMLELEGIEIDEENGAVDLKKFQVKLD